MILLNQILFCQFLLHDIKIIQYIILFQISYHFNTHLINYILVSNIITHIFSHFLRLILRSKVMLLQCGFLFLLHGLNPFLVLFLLIFQITRGHYNLTG